MTAKNDVTGDSIISKPPNDAYLNNYERIFRLSKEQQAAVDDTAGLENENSTN